MPMRNIKRRIEELESKAGVNKEIPIIYVTLWSGEDKENWLTCAVSKKGQDEDGDWDLCPEFRKAKQEQLAAGNGKLIMFHAPCGGCNKPIKE